MTIFTKGQIMMKKIGFIFAAVLLICGIGIFVTQAEEKIPGQDEGLFEYIQIFADAFSVITSDYIKPISNKDLVYGAIRGMTNTLDGYSQFLDQESFKEITEDTKGEFGGMGMEVGIRDEVLTVIAPMEGTPAFDAGIKAGDKILKIDGEITRDISLDRAVEKLRGKPGSKVSISVARKGHDEVIEFEVVRAIIKLKSITEAKVIGGNIGYVRIGDFQKRTARDLKEEIDSLKDKGAESLIIDLRNNPGGLLDAAIDAADYFVDPGKMIVYVEGRGGKKRIDFMAKREDIKGEMKLVVLVNKGSASASEIFAGAIRDNKEGVVLGVTTFGKGSVQAVVPLKDGSAVKITTAAYYTPSGENISEKGITPDIYVENIDPGKNRSKGEDVPETDIKEEAFSVLDEEDTGQEKTAGEDKKALIDIMKDNQLAVSVDILKGFDIFKDQVKAEPPKNQEAGK